MVILDCEDAVKAEDKDAAREAAAEAAAQGFEGKIVAIRINPTGSEHFGHDAVAARASGVDLVVLPKVEQSVQALDAARLVEKPILSMIETAKGVIAADDIASVSIGLMVGTNDLSADLGVPARAGRNGLSYALQAAVVAARAHGIAAFDGVYNKLEDEQGLLRECEEGRALGFDGKSLVHPNQIAAANRLFGPSEEEVQEAARLLAAATGGAERFEGRMIESMHVAQAQAVLAKARR